MRVSKSDLFKKGLGVGIVALFIVAAFVPSINASNSEETNVISGSYKTVTKTPTSTMEVVKETVDKYLKMGENIYKRETIDDGSHCSPQPVLGDNEVFGLWIRIVYNGNEFLEKVDINPQMIRGKLTDPKYRTPIKFDVDDDPEYDIEAGFGFFRYGIDEIHEDGSTTNHDAWAIAFDFYQIDSQLDDQLGEIEVWQEFRVNLALIKNKNNAAEKSAPSNSNILPQITKKTHSSQSVLEQLQKKLANTMRQTGFAIIHKLLNNILNHLEMKGSKKIMPRDDKTKPMSADEDYIVTRVGYRSIAGQKIPLKFEKTFVVDRGTIFRPFVFQHEMNPNDIVGTASNDVMFGFQAYRAGHSSPSYDVEFDVNFDPAVYTVTQFIPRSGKIVYYYHNIGAGDPLDITFSSNLLKGGDPDEEEEGTLSLTLSLDTPSAVAGSGKWMIFDPKIINDGSPLGGKFVYAASHKFDVGFTVNSPRFEEKIEISGIPKSAVFSWGVDVDVNIVQGELLEVEVEGFADLTMSSTLDDIIVYYPKSDPDHPDVTCLRVTDIPSSRELRAGASLAIDNGSMLKLDIGGFVQHDMSSQLGDITLYWPKADPYDPDAVFINVPGGSFSSSGKTSADATLYVDLDDFTNPNNYIYAKAERTSSSDFGEINFYFPNIDVPIVQVYDIPGNALARGKFEWNKLQGYARAQRLSSSGNKDPINVNLVFDAFILSNELRIGNGHIQTDFKIAEDGFFKFDTSNDMLGNTFEVSNSDTGDSLVIDAGTISAENFEADWDLDTSGQQIEVEELALTGSLNAFKNFNISIDLDGKNVDFEGDWSMGEEGSFEIDFYQDENIVLDFDLGNASDDIELNGLVELKNDLHFDMSWKWKQGEWGDHAYFKINENTNEANLEEMNLYFTYKDTWGAEITLHNAGLYVCLEWCWYNNKLYTWPVIEVYGTLDFWVLLDWLTNYEWYEIA